MSQYGWEDHDGKTYGRQELYDTPFHLTTTWVKRQCKGCGYGGDWALLLDAKQQAATPDTSAEHDLLDTDVKPTRISVFFYVADEAGRPAQIQTDGLKGRSGVEGSSRVVQGRGATGGWQLHMASSSKLSMDCCLTHSHTLGLPSPLHLPLPFHMPSSALGLALISPLQLSCVIPCQSCMLPVALLQLLVCVSPAWVLHDHQSQTDG